MENDVCYSTLKFSTSCPVVPKDAGVSENVVYSEIKLTRETTKSNPAMAEEVRSHRCTSYRQATTALGLLSVLLLAGLTAMCVLNIKEVSKYTSLLTLYTNESMAHRILLSEKAVLETEKGELLVQRDQFKNSLQQLITGSFPVGKYCTLTNEEVYCSACMKYWYQNGSSCYLFKTQSRLSWRKSQEYCSEMGGYLVVIDSQEEQEYISQHINYHYDTYHWYWIGLAKKNNTWIWSTGAKVQGNGSWTKPPGNSQAGCVLSNPNKDNLNNWEVNDCSMLNRYICEMKAMVWPSQM
ncbi:C-type lectin domain family 1 member B isoform X2 [Silurus meridionalis]|uniref:C-type lectin domain-containing protein n=1 Tax=Silurus meridionalis TaxID=175797 RepID=A0A8T0BTA7_SILME|nr:C-type lectin domain family 1 member B isoform X2 [Silurus meridionalis]KAF7708550.1 hypothetical protein HF521_017607 [Silurus meridionalis]